MNVYITKLNGLPVQDTSQYIQRMTAEIAHQLGFREMGIYRYNGSGESDDSLNGRMDGIIAGVDWGNDVVICQFLTGNGFQYEQKLISRLKMYQIRIAIFVHDVGIFVRKGNQTALEENVRLYNQAEVLIVPSLAMRQFLLDNGIRKDMKFVIQEMWDYTTDVNFVSSPKFLKEIHFAGGNAFEGMREWKASLPLKLYTASGNLGENVQNMGELSPGELLFALSKGGFGLIWYQDEEARRCMEYEVSFQLARYLAAGIPVIVPKGISNQMLIEKNGLGLIVDSLDEAVTAVEAMTEKEYQKYVRNVGQFAPALRKGYYTKKCLVDAVQAVYRKDAGEISISANVYEVGECAFTYTVLKESYGNNLALSWSYHGEADGFLIYDVSGKLIYETRDMHQHYFLLKGYQEENGFIVKAYVDTWKGKLVVAESEPNYLKTESHAQTCVSVIMPAYNSEDYIARSIDTALAQSLSGLEIIIVDDGSTDSTPKIIDWYAGAYANVVAVHQENGGVAAARNTGIEHANGEYIGFMDNDDLIYPSMMERLYQSAKKNDCDVAVTSVYELTDSEYTKRVCYPGLNEDEAMAVDIFLHHYNYGYELGVVVWNKIYRSSLVKNIQMPVIPYDDVAWTTCILSYADRVCYLEDHSYEWDRRAQESSQLDGWMKQPKQKMFEQRRNAILYFMDRGNPQRMNLLKETARTLLWRWERRFQDEAYGRLKDEIEERY
ncbi:MAG: glycosyltransferase [Ruminococcus flavefaciens]|nr:glycosyltransferase [Ruminococcus flavefaciens]